MQFSDQTFNENFISTIGVDFKIRTIELNEKPMKVQIWDTAGQERFHSITSNYYHGSNAIIVVYDISNRDSFENLKKWIEDVEHYASSRVCKIIVGNKSDLEDKRAVSTDEGQDFAKALGVPFMETSAKTSYNINELFIKMCYAMDERHSKNLDALNQYIPLSEGMPLQKEYSFCSC